MAIYGMRKGVPIVGYLKLGATAVEWTEEGQRPHGYHKKGGKSYPCKWDHIEITTAQRDGNDNLIPDREAMKQLLRMNASSGPDAIRTCGGCHRSKELGFPNGLPLQIPIVLLSNDLDRSFPNRMACYKSSAGTKAWCYGDMQTAHRLQPKGERPAGKFGAAAKRKIVIWGEYADHGPCGAGCPEFENRDCKPNGKLFLQLGFRDTVGTTMAFLTTSWASIANLQNSLEEIGQATGGLISGIPLMFEVSEEKVQPKDGSPAGKAMIARIVPTGGRQQLLEQAAAVMAIRGPMMESFRRLEAGLSTEPWSETEEEITHKVREFYTNGDDSQDAITVNPAPESDTSPAPEPRQSTMSLELDGGDAPEAEKPTTGKTVGAEVVTGSDAAITDTQAMILEAKAEARALALGQDAADAVVILECVLDAQQIGMVDGNLLGNVRVSHMNGLMAGIESYGAPEA